MKNQNHETIAKAKQDIINLLISNSNYSDNIHLLPIIESLSITPNYPIILIGGTNGKGSTCNFIANILIKNGYKTGLFTSPHLLEYNERIRINNENINDYELLYVLNEIVKINKNIGLFQAFTLACHLFFIKEKVEIAVIEVGLGGLKDPTNLFFPTISAITNVDLDHQDILGHNITEIALQKAGIYRTNIPCFFNDENTPEALQEYVKSNNINFKIIQKDYYYKENINSFDLFLNNKKYFSLPIPNLRGKKQIANASLAIAILNELQKKFPIAKTAIKEGLLETNLKGRFQILPGYPQIILDVAHNPHAVKELLSNIKKLNKANNTYAVFGIANDKDAKTIITICNIFFDNWFIAPIKSNKSLSNVELLKIFMSLEVNTDKITLCECIKEAFNKAKNIASTNDRIVCFGSFLVIEEILKEVNYATTKTIYR